MWSNVMVPLLAGLFLAQAASAENIYGFRITDPKEGWIGSADGELRFFPEAIRPGTSEYLVWTASSKTDAAQIWRDPVRGDLKKKYLTIDRDAAELHLLLQAEPVIAWKWVTVKTRGDTNISHLELTEGKFKGRYLGIEDDAVEFTPKDGRKAKMVHKLKLVEKQEQALKFTVYVVAK